MKVVGQCVVGPKEPYFEETLKEFERLCDDAVIATCNATDREKKLIKKYGFWQYEDNREWGRWQPDIKTSLLRKIRGLIPGGILVLDADETVPTMDRQSLRLLLASKVSIQLYVVNLWNDERHYARGLGFWNVRGYNPRASGDSQFLRKPVHCGNAPPFFYNQKPSESYVPHILLHKGLMDENRRMAKHARYDIYDPNRQHKGAQYYDALKRPGSGTEYREEDVIKAITEECKKIGAL